MPPIRTRLDPEGLYARLGVNPAADRAEIAAAYRRQARLLHPDVPKTGDTASFVALRQAYDVLSDPRRRRDYDESAWTVPPGAVEPEVFAPPPVVRARPEPPGRPRFLNLPVFVWIGVGAVLCVSLAEAVIHMRQPVKVVSAGIRPNAQSIEPLPPDAHFATLYGPPPVMLAGTPNFYVIPAATPAVLWRLDASRNVVIPDRQLPPFSTVQGVRLLRQNGMLEVLVADRPDGYIDASHLAPGNAEAARRAYCSYNAGPPPYDGELLDRTGFGGGRLRLDNRSVQPAVVKLRDASGTVALSVFLAPGGHANVESVPEGPYRAEFALGELWSRACGSFAAGMRARRLDEVLDIRGANALVITSDAASPPSTDIADEVFEQKRN
jgi:hypothetical protein